jgi:hypothetical protein
MPEKEQKNKNNSQKIPSFHTLQSDIKKFMEEKKKSFISVTAEELEKEKHISKKKKNWKKILLFGIVIFLLLSGGGYAGFKIYKYVCCSKIIPIILRPSKPLILPDNTEQRVIVSSEKSEFIAAVEKILDSQFPPNTITYIPFARKTNGENIENFNGKIFFKILKIILPFNLTSALKNDFNLIVYTDSLNKNNLIFLFSVKSENGAYSGMLSWERNILTDLNPVLPKRNLTSTSTSPILNLKTNYSENEISKEITTGFKDKIIKNQNIRFLADAKGEPILLYAIFNKILIITFSEQAMETILTRMLL